MKRIATLETEADRLHVHGRELYWLCRRSISRSKLNGTRLEKALAAPTTLRNLSTMIHLVERHRGVA